MPTSPEAASNAGGVVERLRRWSDDPAVTASHTEPLKADVRALLAVVEAAERTLEHIDSISYVGKWVKDDLREALDAFYTPDSAKERR